MSLQYSAERSALLKVLLHAAAHPSQSVNGLLLGKLISKPASGGASDPGSPRSSLQQPTVEIVDALPLFHTYLTLAPMAEVALVQADSLAQAQGLQIVGYYHANERVDDLELGPSGRRIADRIHSNMPQACAVLVDNSKLADFLHQKQPAFLQLFVKESRGWSRAAADNMTTSAGTVPALFLEYFKEGRHRELVDFDDHLNDIKKDWLNANLLS